ncbi:MAG: phage shock protein operon transcriptional activator [Halioglobus sp.]
MMRIQENMIGHSAALTLALEQISAVAAINRPILILGERGTGKELAAERMHFLSERWDEPFIKINCAAIAESLLESELFGHEPGAFTGATRTHHGRFERADGGSIFLDELAMMSMRLQEKLLRLVEYGEYERLGGQQTLHVDVRIIAATNADLPGMAQQEKFRQDLLDRLSFDVVHLPSLSQRREDILELAEHFAIQMCSELGWDLFPGFTEGAQQQLLNHPWPGNIRELKNVVERSLYRWARSDTPIGDIVINPFISPFDEESHEPITAKKSSPEPTEKPVFIDFNTRVAAVEKQLLIKALSEQNYNQRRTAQALGLSYDQLRGLVRKYNLAGKRRV